MDLRLNEDVVPDSSMTTAQTRYKVYVGRGNNSLLIKSLIKRRYWLELVDSKVEDVNFYWTQSKLKDVHV